MAPLGVVSIVGAFIAVIGFTRHSLRTTRAVLQFSLALVSWALLWFATASPFARRGMTNLPDHMVGHVIVMFLVPMGLIGSGSARSIWWALNTRTRRRVLRWWYVDRKMRVPRTLSTPLFAAIALNVVMVSSHLPRVFEPVMTHAWEMDWLMEPAFLLSGLFFFHFLIPSTPRRVKCRLRYQLAMVVVTMLEMLILAMSMSIFTKSAWYPAMIKGSGAMAGMGAMGITAADRTQAFHQQQLAAAILWICGDFWAVPCIVLIVRRLVVRDGSLFVALERQSARFSGSSV